MDALTPQEPAGRKHGAPDDRIAEAQAELRRAAELGAMRSDPLRFVLDAIATALGTIHDMMTLLGATGERVAAAAEQVRKPISQDILGPVQRAAAAGATEEVLKVARTMRWRTAVLSGVGVGLAAAIAFCGGYSWGEIDAASSFRATEASLSAAFQHGPKDAARWLALMRWNNIGDALRHCQAFTDQTSGRRACMVPLWVAPPQKRVPAS